MAFHISKFGHLLRISNGRVKPTSNTRPFRTSSCRFTIYRSGCSSSSEKSFPLKKSKSKSTIESSIYLNSLIIKHGRNGNVRAAEEAFARIPDGDVFARTNMITVYGKNGEIEKARKMFEEMSERTTVSYNAMITAYGKKGQVEKARKMFNEMSERTTVSYNAMITAYGNSDMPDQAYEVFSSMPERDAVSYGAMLSAFVRAKIFDRAERLLSEAPLEFRDPVRSGSVLQGYLKQGNLHDANRFFNDMALKDMVSWSSMVDSYCKAGQVTEARGFFDAMPERNAVTWTSMIHGYLNNGDFEHGFELFSCMRREEKRVDFNSITLAVMFEGCGRFSKHQEGLQIHGLASRLGFRLEVFLGISMVNMYSRLGDMVSATKIFRNMPEHNNASYSSMISAFVQARMFDQAEKLLSKTPSEFCDPDSSGLLLQGYVKEGNLNNAYRIFSAMAVRDMVSWSCMVDGYCKASRVTEARAFFDMMPERNLAAWSSMICGYFTNGDFEQGFELFMSMRREEKKLELDSDTLSVMFRGCTSFSKHREGFQIHGFASRLGFQLEELLGNSMLTMYIRFGDMASAAKIFHDMVEINMWTWNSMIHGYLQCNNIEGALEIFEKVPFQKVPVNGSGLYKRMISALFMNGMTKKAIQLGKIHLDNSGVFWSQLISQLVDEDRREEAIRLFNETSRDEDIRFDAEVFCRMVSASESLSQGTQIQALVIKMNMESELSIQNALAALYSKSGRFSDVQMIFGKF